MDAKKLFDYGVELSRSVVRDGTVYAQETIDENAVIPEFQYYTGPLDSEGKIPVAIDQLAREAEEDRAMGGYGRNRKKVFRDLCENYDDDSE